MNSPSIPVNYCVYELNKKERNRFLILCISGLFAAAFLFYHNFLLSVLFSFLAWPCYNLYRDSLAEKRRRMLTEQFRDVLYSVSVSVAVGRQMTEALYEAEKNMRLIYKEDALIVMELSEIVKRLCVYREAEEDVLRDFASRASIEDITGFVDIYLTCRETGGDFINVLNKASEMILDKTAIEKEINTITAQKRFEIRILSAIPFAIILLLHILSPGYLTVMYDCIQGRLLMTAALMGIGLSYLWSMKLIKIEV